MNEQFKHNDSLPSASDDQFVVSLIKRMQQQLAFLEKKIDILIDQSSRRPFSEKPFSKTSRPFGRPYRPFDREHGGASGEKRFDRGHHFEKRHSEESQRFDHKKKAYGDSRESNFSHDRNFARSDGPKEGFGNKNKPVRYQRRDRG